MISVLNSSIFLFFQLNLSYLCYNKLFLHNFYKKFQTFISLKHSPILHINFSKESLALHYKLFDTKKGMDFSDDPQTEKSSIFIEDSSLS